MKAHLNVSEDLGESFSHRLAKAVAQETVDKGVDAGQSVGQRVPHHLECVRRYCLWKLVVKLRKKIIELKTLLRQKNGVKVSLLTGRSGPDAMARD